jgi:hypothetical protein
MALKMVLGGADLSQVEARVELLLAAASNEYANTDVAKECVRLATAHPSEFDIHRYSASVIMEKSEADVLDTEENPERYLGKRTMHGFMRGMGAAKLADLLLVDGFVVTPETCERRLGRLAARLPAIPEGFFPDVRRQLMRYSGLGTTWGGIWRCDFQRLEEPLYAKGYSYQPVRETVDLINQCGFLPLRNAIKLKRLLIHSLDVGSVDYSRIPRMHIHGHDSLLYSVHPDAAWSVAAFIERTLGAQVRHYAAGSLQVPVTYSLGSTYKMRFEFKRLPSYKEFREAAWACAEAA